MIFAGAELQRVLRRQECPVSVFTASGADAGLMAAAAAADLVAENTSLIGLGRKNRIYLLKQDGAMISEWRGGSHTTTRNGLSDCGVPLSGVRHRNSRF
jgi:hypothetical protein